LPQHALARLELEQLHVEAAALTEAELDHAADVAVALRVARPPAGELSPGGQRTVGAGARAARHRDAGLPPAQRATHELLVAAIALRRVQASRARRALTRASSAARDARIAALSAEVESAALALSAPAARRMGQVEEALALPPGTGVSGLESDGAERFFCGGGNSGKVRSVRRPKRAR
jgi:hypothetical protein